jgi:uncharacterized membrane protein YhaH (DUF805 family)
MSTLGAMWGFDGRISRKYFWLAGSVWTIAFFAVLIPLLYWLSDGQWPSRTVVDGEFTREADLATLIAALVGLYPSLCMSVKRMHDLRMSAWWCVPFFVPSFVVMLLPLLFPSGGAGILELAAYWVGLVVGVAYLIVLGCMRGTAGPNEYGDDPLAARASGIVIA